MPGTRLPHAWVRIKGNAALPPIDVSYVKEFSEQDVKSRQYSTLDLCMYDRFTLLVGSEGQWIERFQALEAAVKQYGATIALVADHRDFEFVFKRQEQLFTTEGKLGMGGGLLIRPDQHVLRLVQPTDPVACIEKSMVEHLGFQFEAEQS